MGTGIPDMIKACLEARLPEPEPIQKESFKMILWRKVPVTDQPTDQVLRLILVMYKEMPYLKKSNDPNQKYRLTSKGKAFQKELRKGTN